MRSNYVKSNYVKSNYVKSNYVKSNYVKSNYVKSNYVKSNYVKLHYSCQELSSLSFKSFHGVFVCGVKINGVSFVQGNFIIVDIDLQTSFKHVIKFLPWVGVGLRLCPIWFGFNRNYEKFSFFVNELFSQVLVPDTVSSFQR